MVKASDYAGKIVIVTGAGQGIGRGVAEAYAAREAQVILAELNPDLGSEAERLITEQGGKALFVPTDVRDPDQIVELMHRVRDDFGTVDILINNAGLSSFGSPYELSVEMWDTIVDTNLRGVFLCSREAAKIMRLRNTGSIVNIASTRAFQSEANSEAYAASKGGIIALTHALAASLAFDGIRVNSISPGWIETGDYDKLRDLDHMQHWSGRVGQAGDIANACLFLTSPGNGFVNGTNLTIDGGMTKTMIYVP
ncbi:MAG: SDR family oxidoreductase [Limnochordia bacterium]|jgi:NAD(P)-dependent dehydrogenase (short-subunit alcohol dehydrogenase family)|nr:SDR family oxidoreductase [Limnochordia bacterium]